jgi:hypothetical protein
VGEGRTYDVSYAEADVRDAVKTYVWRRGIVAQKGLWIAEVLMVGLLVSLSQTDISQWQLLALSVVTALPPCLILIMWAAHYQNTVGKFRRLADRRAKLIIMDDTINLSSNLGSAQIPWSSISDVWERGTYWMLFTDKNQFFTISVAGITQADLGIMRSRSGQSK